MLAEILSQAWIALRRNALRSFLTMLGVVWGIVAITILIAYGNGFRSVLVNCFEAAGKSVVVWTWGSEKRTPLSQPEAETRHGGGTKTTKITKTTKNN